MYVLYTLTRNYYPYLKWSLKSLLEHNKPTKVFIFAEDDELPFEIPCKHQIINMSGQQFFKDSSPNINTPYTIMSMIRVCAPEILKVNKVLYLDVDTVVCDSLEPLWNTDVKGKWLAWCPERFGTWKPYGVMYYNFGVALLNLAQMRKDKVTERIVDDLNTEYFRFNEQDAMNRIIIPDKMTEIDVRYNESFCCGVTDNPAIVHYAGHPEWYENRTIFRWEYLYKYL